MSETNIIQVAGAPPIPGLVFRMYRGPADLAIMLPIAEASESFDGEQFARSLEEVERQYETDHSCDPYRDVLLVEVEGKLIGYCKCWWHAERNDGQRIYSSFCLTHPEWRGRGLGAATLEWQEAHLREIAEQHPAQSQKSFAASCSDTQPARAALLTAFGYHPIRESLEMSRSLSGELPAFPLPAGLVVRPVEHQQRRSVLEACVEAFDDHWGAGVVEGRDYDAWLANPDAMQTHLWQVAWDVQSNQIAGCVLPGIFKDQNEKFNRKRGYIEDVGVRRPWRKRGLARALLARGLAALRDHGMTEARLGVDSESLTGATRLYTDCGFRVVKRYYTYRKAMGE